MAAEQPGADANPPELLPGHMLGQFRVAGRLGRGGMGVVYEAEDTLLGRRVAIKTLPGPGDAAARRLLREARAAARLDHPNVIRVLHVGEWDGGHYLVLELAPGGSLLDRLGGGPLLWADATRAAADACRGLAAAHAAGLVHRDVKPANLMLGAGGAVKVADFGLVRGGDLGVTATGRLAGTPHFMSPEQWRREPADARSDVYALGATYYALLTGAPPFPAPVPLQAMFAHLNHPPPDPRAEVPELPAGCAAVVGRAMAKEPAARYQSADEMGAALSALLAPAALVPVAVTRPAEAPPARPRRFAVAGGAPPQSARRGWWPAAVTAIGLALAAGWLLRGDPAPRPELPPAGAPERKSAGAGAGKRSDPVEPPPVVRKSGPPAAVREHPAPYSPELMDAAGAAVAGGAVPTAVVPPGPSELATALGAAAGAVTGGAMTPKAGDHFDPRIPAAGAAARTAGPVRALSYSPDGALLAAGGAGGAVIWNTATGRATHQLRWGELLTLSFADYPHYPDQVGSLLGGGGPRGARQWLRGTGKVQPFIDDWNDSWGAASAVAGGPGGQVAIGYNGRGDLCGRVVCYEPKEQSETYRLDCRDDGSAVTQIAYSFSPANRALAVVNEKNNVRLFDTKDGRQVFARLEFGPGPRPVLAFPPTGTLMLVAVGDRVRFFDCAPPKLAGAGPAALVDDGKPLRLPAPGGAAILTLAVSSDGRYVAAGDAAGNVTVCDLAARRPLKVLAAGPQAVQAVAFRPGGGVLAAGGADGLVRLWDVKKVLP